MAADDDVDIDDAGKHEQARQLAEAALRAQRAGDRDKADELLAEADRTDPAAVINVLQEHQDEAWTLGRDTADRPSDEEVARITNEVRPGSDAPSRANITGPGSGADAE